MSERESWVQLYAICRQHGDPHHQAVENADAAMEKVKLLKDHQQG
jgi:hypothetical protein